MPRPLFGSSPGCDGPQEGQGQPYMVPDGPGCGREQSLPGRSSKATSPSWDEQTEEIADLVAKANAGDERALEVLIFDKFANYLSRWENFLVRRNFSMDQSDIREFICLYVRDKSVRKRIRSRRYSQEVMNEVWRVVGEINHLVLSLHSEEDLRQIIYTTFLHCLRRYTPRKDKDGNVIPFFRYFYYRFRMELKTNLTKVTMDPVFSYGYVETDTEEGEKIVDLQVDDLAEDELVEGYNQMHVDLDWQWISGEGSKFPFNHLSPHERQLIKWHYRDQLRRKEIAEILGCSRVLVSAALKVACERLRGAIASDEEDWDWLDWEEE